MLVNSVSTYSHRITTSHQKTDIVHVVWSVGCCFVYHAVWLICHSTSFFLLLCCLMCACCSDSRLNLRTWCSSFIWSHSSQIQFGLFSWSLFRTGEAYIWVWVQYHALLVRLHVWTNIPYSSYVLCVLVFFPSPPLFCFLSCCVCVCFSCWTRSHMFTLVVPLLKVS